MTPERQALIDALLSSDLSQATEAAVSLSIPGDSHALSSLMSRLNGAPVELALVIISQLLSLGDSRAIPSLVSCMKDPSEEVRGEALHALIALGEQNASSIHEQVGELTDGFSPNRALTQIVVPADFEAIDLLRNYLEDDDPELRIAAAYGLGSLRVKGMVERLAQLAQHDADEDVQTAATYALGQLVEGGITEALPPLRRIGLSTANAETLVAALKTLSFYTAKLHVEQFIQAYDSSEERLRQLAVIGMGQAQDEAVLPSLIKALKDRSTHVQRLAANAIGRIGQYSSIEPLLMAAATSSAELRSAVAHAFKQFDRTNAEAVLNKAAQASSADVRKVTAYVAAKNHFHRLCIDLTKDQSELVRKQATLGLADVYELDPIETARAIIAGLADAAWQVRVASIEAIVRTGDPMCFDVLKTLENDEHHVVEQAIRRALSRI